MDKLIADFLLTSEFGNIGVEFTLALHQTVLQIESLADALVLLEVSGLPQNFAVIVHPAECRTGIFTDAISCFDSLLVPFPETELSLCQIHGVSRLCRPAMLP